MKVKRSKFRLPIFILSCIYENDKWATGNKPMCFYGEAQDPHSNRATATIVTV